MLVRGDASSSHGGGVPHPGHGGGYPIQSWWGGNPSSHSAGGVPHPVMVGGTPGTPPHHPDLAGGGYLGYPPPSWPGMGYPSPHHPDLGWGTPPHHPDLGWGTPPTPFQTWDGVPPYPALRWGTPPPMVNRQTFPSINITFPRTTYAGGKYINCTSSTTTCVTSCNRRSCCNFLNKTPVVQYNNLVLEHFLASNLQEYVAFHS